MEGTMRTRLAALLGTVLATGVACSAADETPLAIYGGEWNGDDALLVGTLAHQGSCLYIVDPSGYSPAPAGRPVLLAFGIGTGWDAKNKTVSYGGRELRVGEVVEVGGSSPPGAPAKTKWVASPAPECDSRVIWFVGGPPPAK